ncbi:MAG: (d)CMP kinase [Actinomycetota bacterium]|nr:(d)CMP kinase [Actinomycetota bacterium]
MTAVAIDGPAAAGKSTVARAVADALGYAYLDTGALYRAVTLAALERGIDVTDGATLADLVRSVSLRPSGAQLYLDEAEITQDIRRRDVTAAVSVVSAHPQVRGALLDLQRAVAESGDVVMEGRDIGTKVLPDADVKVFLTATLDERTSRRARELGVEAEEMDELRSTIASRDSYDSSRRESPLSRAPDAIAIDTTGKSINEVVAEVVSLVAEVVS